MILDFILWFTVMILKILWFVVSTFYPVILVGLLIGVPLYRLSKMEGSWVRMEKPVKSKYRLTPQEPAVYYNRFGHIIKVDPVPGSEDEIRQYFRDLDVDETNFRGDNP